MIFLIFRGQDSVPEGNRAFASAAPRLWNALPLIMRQSGSFLLFKSALNAHISLLSIYGALGSLDDMRFTNVIYY